MDWLEHILMGVVQGLTEFLPVSSDGHLTIVQEAFAALRGTRRTEGETLFIDVMLHVATLAAIVLYYRAVVRTGAKGLLGSPDVPPPYRKHAVIRTGTLAVVASLPLVLDVLFKKKIEEALQSLTATGVGFLITAAVLLIAQWLRGRREGSAAGPESGKGPAETTYLDAFLIGLAESFAPLPGVSRSGLTVAMGLARGLSPAWAVGFSLLIAVPAISGATVVTLRKFDTSVLTGDRVGQVALAMVLAGVIGSMAILWLVRIVRSGRVWYFSVYLIIVAAAVLAWSAVGGKSGGETRDGGAREGAQSLGRPVRGEAPRPGDRPRADGPRRPWPLGRADAPGPRPGVDRVGPEAPRPAPGAGVLLGGPLGRGGPIAAG